jgi:hypothetical protein
VEVGPMARRLRRGRSHRGTAPGVPEVLPELLPGRRNGGILPEGNLGLRPEARRVRRLFAPDPGAPEASSSLSRRCMSARVGREQEGLKGFCPNVMIGNSHGFDLTLMFR